MTKMILVDQAVLEQALEAMLNFPDDISDDMFESITALKAALARQAGATQEPHQDLRAALQAPGCERLREWVEIGPVQRAALETFVAALAQQTQVQQAQALNDWARDKLARYGIDMPDDPKA